MALIKDMLKTFQSKLNQDKLDVEKTLPYHPENSFAHERIRLVICFLDFKLEIVKELLKWLN